MKRFEGIERRGRLDGCGKQNRKGNEAYLLELLDGSLVDTTALVDQVTGLISLLALS